MKSIRTEIVQVVCEKCGHTWIPIVKSPRKCPRCQHLPGSKIRKIKIEVIDLCPKLDPNESLQQEVKE